MEEQEKAIGMKSIRAYSGVLTYIDTVTGKTIHENEYETKYKDYTAKVRHINITDVRNQLTTAQNNQFSKMTNNEMVTNPISPLTVSPVHALIYLLTYLFITQVCIDNDQDNTKENDKSMIPNLQCTDQHNDEHIHIEKKKKVEN